MSAEEVLKVPLLVEVIGEPSSGKTHLSCLFPKPALIDTTPKGEDYVILRRLFPMEWKKRYFRVRVFQDFNTYLKQIKADTTGFFKTVIVDTSVDLRSLGAEALLKTLPDRKRLMPEEWGPVNAQVDEFITEINDPRKMGMNLVLTAQMQDEWVDRKTTGRRIRKGIPTMNFQADMRLFLQLKQAVDPKTMHVIPNEYFRECVVVKCRFRNQADKSDWIPVLKDLSWKGIKELSKLEAGEFVE